MNRLLRAPIAGACLLSLFLAGCGGSSPMTMDNYNKIQDGMTMEQVSEVMGFPPPDFDKTSIVPGLGVTDTKNGVDRETKTTIEGDTYDFFQYKELGGTNKKEIQVTYLEGKVVKKNQSGL